MTRRRKPVDGLAQPLSPPAAGRLLSPVVGYVRRKTAQQQADRWNEVLRRDPDGGGEGEYVVRVSSSKDNDGTWKLVWHRVGTSLEFPDTEQPPREGSAR